MQTTSDAEFRTILRTKGRAKFQFANATDAEAFLDRVSAAFVATAADGDREHMTWVNGNLAAFTTHGDYNVRLGGRTWCSTDTLTRARKLWRKAAAWLRNN